MAVTQSYASILVERGLSDPAKREELADRLLDASEILGAAAHTYANSLVSHLEGHEDEDVGGSLDNYRATLAAFEKAHAAAGVFLAESVLRGEV